MTRIISVCFLLCLVFGLNVDCSAETRADLVFEYNKMRSNDSGLGYRLPGRVGKAENGEIKAVLDKAWLKKRILMYLNLLGIWDVDLCGYSYPTNSEMTSLLNRCQVTYSLPDKLGLTQISLDRLQNLYRLKKQDSSFLKALARHNIKYTKADILFRVYKRDLLLQLYVRPRGSSQKYALIGEYDITSPTVKIVGPKLRAGDGQVPEGIYSLAFYPAFKWSDFFLAYRIPYPNKADRNRRRAWQVGGSSGGSINFHGCCASIGCIPVGNPAIIELFPFIEANRRAESPKMYIFPFTFDDPKYSRLRQQEESENKNLIPFWKGLEQIDREFTKTLIRPGIVTDQKGNYRISGVSSL